MKKAIEKVFKVRWLGDFSFCWFADSEGPGEQKDHDILGHDLRPSYSYIEKVRDG